MPHRFKQVIRPTADTKSLYIKDLLHGEPANGLHDLIGIGFGPASLAIAVAIYDEIEERASHGSINFRPALKFLERQSAFGWHTGMLLPDTKMQISFIKDLATMRNPASHFTFLNYLQEHNRLVQFSNLNTFLPLRVEFEDYLKWSAGHFKDIVQYSRDVVGVRPLRLNDSSKYNCLEVTSRNNSTGEVNVQLGRNVIIAVGGRPSWPAVFPQHHRAVMHSSQYNYRIDDVLPKKDGDYNIAVIGAGQSGAEIFNDLHSRYPNSKTHLLIRDVAMRPSDDSPFVNEVFNPDFVDQFYTTPATIRKNQLKVNKATNYSVVRLTLLEQIYEDMYQQRLEDPDSENWQHRILSSREVVEVTETSEKERLNLVVRSLVDEGNCQEVISVDAVVLATGYVRDVHNEMLKECKIINSSCDDEWIPERDYKLGLNRDLVEDDVNIYLQGCNEQTHGLSDTLLSVLATRGGEIAKSVFGGALLEANVRDLVQSTGLNGPLGPLWKLHKTQGVSIPTKVTESSSVQTQTAVKA
ncbi:hypothetical protein LTR64_005021 [Lithohypha guttulata]|uniref:uncharacterized protein n=1 Tax=Lithohypha guttulata TaxID=1690604 RepID=UPI002DE1BBD6|nr:hypothetical protein LTR51_005144 [Lithohypha guttulata]